MSIALNANYFEYTLFQRSITSDVDFYKGPLVQMLIARQDRAHYFAIVRMSIAQEAHYYEYALL